MRIHTIEELENYLNYRILTIADNLAYLETHHPDKEDEYQELETRQEVYQELLLQLEKLDK